MDYSITIHWPFQITLLWLSIFDLPNAIDAKTVVTFTEYVNFLFSVLKTKNIFIIIYRKFYHVLFSVPMVTCNLHFLFSASKA